MQYKLNASAIIEAEDMHTAYVKLAHYFLSKAARTNPTLPQLAGFIYLDRQELDYGLDPDPHAIQSPDHF